MLETNSRQTTTRVALTATGAALMAIGLTRRSVAGTAAALIGSDLLFRGVQGHSHLYQVLLNKVSPGNGAADADSAEVQRSITIGKSEAEIRQVWNDPQTLPRIAPGQVEVSRLDDQHTRWSFKQAPLQMRGSISCRPAQGDRGTEVTLRLHAEQAEHSTSPLARAATLTPLRVVPKDVAGTTLRHLKSLLETGEIPTLERNPFARAR